MPGFRPLLLAAVAALAPQLVAAEALTQDQILSAALLPGWQTSNGSRMSALRLDLAPHWKTYWRSPGDAGIPPEFDWSGSDNLAGVRLHWPRPQVFDLNGMQSIGYKKHLVLPLELTAVDPAKPGTVTASPMSGHSATSASVAVIESRAPSSASAASPAAIACASVVAAFAATVIARFVPVPPSDTRVMRPFAHWTDAMVSVTGAAS